MPEQRTLWSRLKDFLGFGRKEDEKPARTQGQKAPDQGPLPPAGAPLGQTAGAPAAHPEHQAGPGRQDELNADPEDDQDERDAPVPGRKKRFGPEFIPMNLSSTFIRRPVATTLLTIALAVSGAVSFQLLPVAPPAATTVDRVVEMVPEAIDKITDFIEKQQEKKKAAQLASVAALSTAELEEILAARKKK